MEGFPSLRMGPSSDNSFISCDHPSALNEMRKVGSSLDHRKQGLGRHRQIMPGLGKPRATQSGPAESHQTNQPKAGSRLLPLPLPSFRVSFAAEHYRLVDGIIMLQAYSSLVASLMQQQQEPGGENLGYSRKAFLRLFLPVSHHLIVSYRSVSSSIERFSTPSTDCLSCPCSL